MYKKTLRNPATAYLFCFSKRAFKQNRANSKYKANKKKFIRKSKLNKFAPRYKFYNRLIKNIVKMNQWNVNKKPLKYKFINSFFLQNNFFVGSKKYHFTFFFKLKLWSIFKNRYNLFLKKFIVRYVHLGALSSHIVHALSRKNLTYQTRSKYRPALPGTHMSNE